MIVDFMIRYLTRRNYLVVPYRISMLVVSGNATAVSDDGVNWTVTFQIKPFMVALAGSYIGVQKS